jgi:transcriptional regulator with XRE-family HTH domain
MTAQITYVSSSSPARIGEHLRAWRQRRRLSQLDLAGDAEISTRHLSFLETGRAAPSRDMVLRLAERLDVPLRERNVLLVAAGFAPAFPDRSLDDPALAAARQAVETVLKAHEPYPALAVDRHWTLISHNRAVPPLLSGVAPHLLKDPLNVLRVSLHPEGLAPAIVNLPQWRAHLLDRLRQQVAASADPVLADLHDELRRYPLPPGVDPDAHDVGEAGVIVPMIVRTPAATLSFISTTTVFGTPVEITLSELALETFFPADAATAEALRTMAKDWAPTGH